MSNLHPGLILLLVGFLALLAPKPLRRFVIGIGPLAALAAFCQLRLGTDLTVSFSDNTYILHYLHVDELSWLFGLVFCMIAAIGGIYAMHNDNRMEALCSMAYACGALGVTFANDWLTLIFFWELMAATSLFLIWCNDTKAARQAGYRYLLVHMFGGNLLLAGIFLKVRSGDLMITNLAAGPHDAAFWLILTGIAINTAIPPLHAWLVDSYPEGTVTGSVFLSSFTTKVGVLCLIRIFAGTEMLIWAGAVMVLYGACYAIMENDMRRLLSYHIISQVGFMVAVVGLGTGMGSNGAAAHAFGNILFKSILFMATGAIIYATGVRRINELGGMAKKLPWVFLFFVIAALSISGVPGFIGFVTKSMTISAAADAHNSTLELILQLGSIGTFLSITLKMIYFIFLAPDRGVEIKQTVPFNMYVAMGIGSVLCIAYGVYPELLYRYLPYQMAPFQPYTLDHAAQYLQMVGMAMIPFMMYLPKMEPHTALSLDTDWFYRKPFASIVEGISYLGCAITNALGSAWEALYEKSMDISHNPMEFLDAKPLRNSPKYNPENYRTSIADPIMITLTVLFCSLCYFMAII